MSDPCTKTEAISELHNKIDRLVELLEQVAVQRTELRHVQARQDEHREWLKGLEGRTRKVEMQPGQVAGKVLVIAYTLFGSAVGSIVSGVVVWSIRS